MSVKGLQTIPKIFSGRHLIISDGGRNKGY